uniref:Uncharacterized protein n=1 Tax=Arundo donax TaxID=35708 RepID=A0A0A9CBE4_ARUDO
MFRCIYACFLVTLISFY